MEAIDFLRMVIPDEDDRWMWTKAPEGVYIEPRVNVLYLNPTQADELRRVLAEG